MHASGFIVLTRRGIVACDRTRLDFTMEAALASLETSCPFRKTFHAAHRSTLPYFQSSVTFPQRRVSRYFEPMSRNFSRRTHQLWTFYIPASSAGIIKQKYSTLTDYEMKSIYRRFCSRYNETFDWINHDDFDFAAYRCIKSPQRDYTSLCALYMYVYADAAEKVWSVVMRRAVETSGYARVIRR